MRLAMIRYSGLAAAALLAVVGVLGGALPHGDLLSTPVSVARGPYGPVILCGWLVGTVVQAYAWWAARDRIPSARWALVTAGLWILPFLVVPPMGSRDVYSYACQGYLYLHGVDPYAHGVQTLPCPWLDGVSPIWRDTAAPYGPLFVLVAAAVVGLGGASLVAVVALFRVVALLGLTGVALSVPVLARRCGVPVGRALWIVLAGPLVAPHLIGGPHNDGLMLGVLVGGLAVAAMERSRETTGRAPTLLRLAAGLLLGLALAVKATAIVVVPFAILLVAAPPYRRWPAIRAGAELVGGVVAAMGVVTVAAGLGLGWVNGLLGTKDLIQFTSPPTAVGMTLTYAGRLVDRHFNAVPAVRALALVLLAGTLVLLWWRSARSADPVPTALRGAGLALAAIVALMPFFHPWYAMWPLAVLAATTIRTNLVMAAATAGPLLVLPDGGGLARYAKFPGAPLMTALLVVLAVTHVRRRRSEAAEPPDRPTPRDSDSPAPARRG